MRAVTRFFGHRGRRTSIRTFVSFLPAAGRLPSRASECAGAPSPPSHLAKTPERARASTASMALLRSSRTSNRSVPRRALRFRTESTWDSPPDVRTVVSLILRADLPDRRTTCAPTGGMDGDAGAAEEGEEAGACPSPRPPAGPPPRAIVRTPALAERTLRLRLGDGGGVASPSAGSSAAAAGRAASRTSSSSLLARSWASRAAPWESLLDAAATSLAPMSSSPLTPSGSTCCSCAARTASITPLSDLARSARSAGSHTWYSMPRSHRSSPSSAAAAASPHPHVRPDDAPPPPSGTGAPRSP